MKILISNSSDLPLYQQIKDQLKDDILQGDLKDGDSMPSIRRFANDLGVSVLTIRRVYDELEQEGFLVQQVGVGTFVSAANAELLRDARRRVVEQKMQDALESARGLHIPGMSCTPCLIFFMMILKIPDKPYFPSSTGPAGRCFTFLHPVKGAVCHEKYHRS